MGLYILLYIWVLYALVLTVLHLPIDSVCCRYIGLFSATRFLPFHFTCLPFV